MSNDTVRANAHAMPADRRAVLRSLFAAGALSSIPTGAVSAEAFAAPDVEILALAAELVRVQRRLDDIKTTRVDPFEEEWSALLMRDWAAAETFGLTSGRTAAIEEIERIDLAAVPAFRRMMALPARTQAGKAAKVRAVLTYVLTDEWRGPAADLDWDKEQVRALLAEFSGMNEAEVANV